MHRKRALRDEKKNTTQGAKSEEMIQPLQFGDIFKHKLWGGSEIGRLKGIDAGDDVGESFEISALPGDESRVVTPGPDEGLTLRRLIAKYGERLMGRKNFARYGDEFPLLVKFIYSAKDLSVQVHPNDEIAHAMGHPYGKNEMWYIVRADQGATVRAGFKTDFSPQRYEETLADQTLSDHINTLPTHPGDCFYIPSGCIHSISAGNLLIEVQQSSDDTFRVYDFGRRDADGRLRELHVDQARRALNYAATADPRLYYTAATGRPVEILRTDTFTTRLCRYSERGEIDYRSLDAFVILVGFEGTALLRDAEGREVTLREGRTVLFPAENPLVSVEPLDGRPCGFIETFVDF